jgi:hypothetical protein
MTQYDFNVPIPEEPGVCKTCGAQITANFCSNCGEKKFIPGEHTIRHFFGDVLNAITSLDGNFLQTAKLMIMKPGVMSYQYIHGRRVPFIKPMSMFFIVNLIYFMFSYGDALNTTLYAQMHNIPFQSEISTKIVEKKLKAEKKNLKNFTVEYHNQSTDIAKSWLILMVLYFSVPLALVNYNRKVFYFDHLTVSLEFMSTATMILFIILPLIFSPLIRLGIVSEEEFNLFSKYPLILMSLLFLYLFERNTYKQSIFRSLTKASLLVFFFYVTLQVYRVSLFYITMWTL